MGDHRRRPLKIGVFIGLFEDVASGLSPRWTDVAAMARRAEELGFDSVWLPDHLLVPGDPADETGGVWECGSMLAALAAVTSSAELGTLVMCSSFRNPTLIAKMADTIDEISGGRLILGVGAGYYEPEYRAFGYPFDHRSSRFAEAIQIIHGLLKTGRVDFEGRYYQARECVLRPRGPRQNGPPIMIATRGPKTLRLAAQYADLWGTNLMVRSSLPSDVEPGMGMLLDACIEVGRDPSTLGRAAMLHWSAPDRTGDLPAWIGSRFGPPLTGAPDEVAEVFRAFSRAGITHAQVVIWPHTLAGVEAFGSVLEALDRDD
jgi:probable F420-dependent oxidoreductase